MLITVMLTLMTEMLRVVIDVQDGPAAWAIPDVTLAEE
jgi:hypothetical protein